MKDQSGHTLTPAGRQGEHDPEGLVDCEREAHEHDEGSVNKMMKEAHARRQPKTQPSLLKLPNVQMRGAAKHVAKGEYSKRKNEDY